MSGLVYIGAVKEICSIEGADRIESLTVVCGRGGIWRGCAQKGQFKEGDLCEVYLQDALLPPDERFAFMEKHKYRVRMCRFLGVPSEVLIMPLTKDSGSVGMDITECTGVMKYEKPIPTQLQGEILSSFPSFIPKTDEPNFQTVPEMVQALSGYHCYATEKVDGTSMTAYRIEDHFGVCGRNWEHKPSDSNAYWRAANALKLAERIKEGHAWQMELAGPGIQKNPLGLKEIKPFIFDAYDIGSRDYINPKNVIGKFPEIYAVKDVWEGVFPENCANEWLYKLAEGLYPSGRQREGIVIRPANEMTVDGKRLSFKVINLLYKERS